MTSASSIQETDAAPRNALDLVSEGKLDSLKGKAAISSGECSMDGNVGSVQNENGEYNSNELVPVNVSDEELESELDICKLSLKRNRVPNKGVSNKITPCEIEEIDNGKLLFEGSSKKELIFASDENDNNDKSVSEMGIIESDLQGVEQELDIYVQDGEDPKKNQLAMRVAKSKMYSAESASTTKKPSTVKGSTLHVTHGKLEESASSKPVSPSNKQQKHAQKTIRGSFDRERPVEALDKKELIDPSSEVSGSLGKLSKSPTTGSSYSYDGMNEQFPTPHLDSLRNSHTVAEGRTGKGKGLVNSLLYGDFGTQHQSDMLHEKHHVMKDSRRTGTQKMLEATRHGDQHWMRTKRDEFPIQSRMPFHQSGHESGTPSNRMRDDLHSKSSFASPNSNEDTEQEKVKLLRMINQLQEQLQRSRSLSEESNGRFPSTGFHHISAYHDHDPHKGRFPHTLNHLRYNERSSHEVVSRQRHNFSQMPYSAEATRSSPHVDHSYYHFHPHFSTDLPPHVPFHHEGLHRSYPGQDYSSYHRFYPSTPQSYAASKSGDQRNRVPAVRKHSREKKNLAKRHHKPVAGGAPFVTCHNRKCLNLLHLPVDFLLSKKACHQLRCGKCSEILEFSLQNGRHMVSFSSNAKGPPSSELNDQSKVISGSYHANYYKYSPAEPISFVDDYGLPVSKSHSSEGDPGYLTQFHPLHGSKFDHPTVSGGTIEPITEREKIASRYSSTIRAPVEKLSTETEAGSTPTTSSLHKLMGYFSPSQVRRGTRSSVKGKRSS